MTRKAIGAMSSEMSLLLIILVVFAGFFAVYYKPGQRYQAEIKACEERGGVPVTPGRNMTVLCYSKDAFK